MDFVVSLLYILSIVALGSMAVLAFHRDAKSPLHRSFALTCVSLVAWLGSLYVFGRLDDPAALTLLGRINFVSVAFAVTFAFLFSSSLAKRTQIIERWPIYVFETGVLGVITLFTSLVDKLEHIQAGEHVTVTGVLFPMFVIHIVVYGVGAVVVALGGRKGQRHLVSSQLSLVGYGIGATVGVNLITGLLLPYVFGIFWLQELGALSAAVFAGAVAYSIVVDRLLDIKLVVRKTLIAAVLIAMAEQLYVQGVSIIVNSLPASTNSPELRQAISFGAVLFIAATFQPIKEWIERVLNKSRL